jgi:hypothetical protein
MSKLTAQLASLPDRENVVYEIYSDSDQVTEVSNEPDNGIRIEIFPCPHTGKIWNFDFNEFYTLIEQAKQNIDD